MRHLNTMEALNGTSWAEHRALILTKLDEHHRGIEQLKETVQKMAILHATEIARLQVKAGLTSCIGGAIAVLLTLGIATIAYLKK